MVGCEVTVIFKMTVTSKNLPFAHLMELLDILPKPYGGRMIFTSGLYQQRQGLICQSQSVFDLIHICHHLRQEHEDIYLPNHVMDFFMQIHRGLKNFQALIERLLIRCACNCRFAKRL